MKIFSSQQKNCRKFKELEKKKKKSNTLFFNNF